MGSVDVKIDNPDSDGIGEIVVRGDNVMLGYLGEPELTAEVLKDGWFYTGDMGYMDKEGYIFITGRKKDVIVLSNGKNVFPDELEQVIGLIEYVNECLVFEIEPDTLAANVVYNTDYFEGKDAEYVNNTVISDITNINKKLVSYKRIKSIYVSDEPMIKTSTAKIKRQPSIEKIKAERQPMNIMK
jgi:long-chain acyl-CoA synthetase